MDSGGPRKHRGPLDGAQIPYVGAIIRGKDMPEHARRHSAVSCSKMAEPIDLRVWVVDSGGPKEGKVQSYSPGCVNVRS